MSTNAVLNGAFWVFMAFVLPTLSFFCGYHYGKADGIRLVHKLFLEEVEDNRLFRELVKSEVAGRDDG